MLILNARDIDALTDVGEAVGAIEKALAAQESKAALVPERMHVDFEGNTLLLMPALAGEALAVKSVSIFPGNGGIGKPVIFGTVVLGDGRTGEPLALLNGGKLTAVRTAAVSAAAIKLLAEAGASTLGLVGAGVQGLHQARFACSVRPIRDLYLFDPAPGRPEALAASLSAERPDVRVHIARSIRELQEESGLIITATTSRDPVLAPEAAFLKNRTVIAVGSYQLSHRELPDALFDEIDQCFIDTESAKRETADVAGPLKRGALPEGRIFTLGKLLDGSVRLSGNPTRLFKSVGSALFDVFVAAAIHKKAREHGTGAEIEL